MIHKTIQLLALVSCFSVVVYGHTEDPQPTRKPKPNESVKVAQKINQPIKLSRNHVDYIQLPVAESVKEGTSGYHALKNALVTLEHLAVSNSPDSVKNLKDERYEQELFSSEKGSWRQSLVELRKSSLVVNHLKDRLLLALKGAQKVSFDDITSMNFSPLFLEEAVVVFDKELTTNSDFTKLRDVIIPSVAKKLVKQTEVSLSGQSLNFTFTREQILTTIKDVVDEKLPGSMLEKNEILELYMPGLTDVQCAIESSTNENKVLVNKAVVHTQTYSQDTKALDGESLTDIELKTLFKEEAIKTNSLFKGTNKPIHVECFEFPHKHPAEVIIHSRKLKTLNTALEKDGKAVVFIAINNHWIAAVLWPKNAAKDKNPLHEIIKSKSPTVMIVSDSKNQDRSEEIAIKSLFQMFDVEPKKATDTQKPDDFFNSLLKPDQPKKTDTAEKANYDHPLSGYSLEDLPPMEDLFGGKIPNNILIRVKQIAAMTKASTDEDKKKKPGTIIKNCTLFYGPPGTGKSTISYVMTLLAEKEAGHKIDVKFAGGGDFRDAYQGSGKAKLDALFQAAVDSENPCVIIIDEIDGASSKLEPRSSTQEDNRAIKTLITTLDKYRYHKGLYVICTTNYPEKIDPAILRRFSSIEIPLPDYQMRKRNIEYYLKLNDVEVKAKDDKSVSPQFFDNFLTATEGMSGDALSDIVNNAVHEYRLGLQPENGIDLSFRFNNIDFKNRSVWSNIAPVLATPLVPLAHYLNRYPSTDLDKHLYAQYMRHYKLKVDLDGQAQKKALEDYRAKQLPLFDRWKKIIEHSTISHITVGTLGAFAVYSLVKAAKNAYSQTYHATNGAVQIPWVPTP